MGKKIDLQAFKACLELLNQKLKAIGASIEIKAIGGFALLYHGVRQSGYTQDIDTLTTDYSVEIISLIEDVGREVGAEDDWLNNQNVFDNDVETVEEMLEPFWEKLDWELSNIQLYVADLETLLRSKLIAAEDDNLSGRVQDFPDLIDIFAKMDMETAQDCADGCTKMGIELKLEYPRTYQRIAKLL